MRIMVEDTVSWYLETISLAFELYKNPEEILLVSLPGEKANLPLILSLSEKWREIPGKAAQRVLLRAVGPLGEDILRVMHSRFRDV